jgi:type VI secretion system protein ImpK
MTTAPSLFSSPAPLRPSTAAAAAPARSLVDLLYDGFYLLTLLRKHSMPADADAFSGAIQGFLDDFERAALKAGFASQDIFDAKYAFCAAVDEAVLGARTPIRDAWERRPLQLALFGEQLAGENFFEKLEAARNGGASRIQALEVFHLCLLTGFKGRYLLEGPEKLKYLVSQLGEQITHIKGKARLLAPLGPAGPDRQRDPARDPPVDHRRGARAGWPRQLPGARMAGPQPGARNPRRLHRHRATGPTAAHAHPHTALSQAHRGSPTQRIAQLVEQGHTRTKSLADPRPPLAQGEPTRRVCGRRRRCDSGAHQSFRAPQTVGKIYTSALATPPARGSPLITIKIHQKEQIMLGLIATLHGDQPRKSRGCSASLKNSSSSWGPHPLAALGRSA